MTKQQLLSLIKQGEGQNLEFQERPKEKDKEGIGKTICAFANTNDGVILVGVSDDHKIVGTSKKTESQIANVAHSCKPSIYPNISHLDIEGETILIVEIKKTGNIHSYKNIAYKRVGTHDMPLSPEEVIKFAKATGEIRFDHKICKEASLEDVDKAKVKWFLKEAAKERNFDVDPDTSTKQVLEKLELVKDGKLTNAAILLFGKNPQRFFLQAETRCARFRGTKPIKPFIDMKVFGGNIIDQANWAKDFVLRHTSMAAWVESGKIERQEKWEYPPDAIREAIVNAICHRDYEISSNVQVRIFDDRIEIWGCGPLPKPLTVEDLKGDHRSILRNPLIGKCFFLIKFIEQWGTGTNDIINMCLAWELPEPLFEYIAGSLVVTFRKSKLTEEYLNTLILNTRQKKAIEYLKKNKEISNKVYREINNIGKVIAAEELNDLVRKRILKTIGKGRATKYVLDD